MSAAGSLNGPSKGEQIDVSTKVPLASREQLASLRGMLASVPHYRSYAGFVDLEEIPITGKSMIIGRYDEFISEKYRREREAILKFLGIRRRDARKRFAERLRKEFAVVVNSTSGTTGIPLYVFKKISEAWRIGVNIWKVRRRFDSLVDASTLFPMFHAPIGYSRESVPNDGTSAGIWELYRKLSSKGIRWIHTSPRLLQKHMAEMKSLKLTSCGCESLRYVEVSGAPMGDGIRAEVESFFAPNIINQYGTQETLVIGYSDAANGFDIIDGVIVEILDANGRRIDESGIVGRVAVTSLSLELVPFVRYLTSDRGSWKRVVDPDTFEERKLLFLETDRESNMILHRGRYLSGNHLFKEVVYAVNNRMGQSAIGGKIRYMQIRQVGEDEIVLVVNSFPGVRKYHQIFTEVCNSEEREIKVHLRVLRMSTVEGIDMTKHCLFIKDFTN